LTKASRSEILESYKGSEEVVEYFVLVIQPTLS